MYCHLSSFVCMQSNLCLDPKIVADIDIWLLFRGHLCKKKFQNGPQNGGRYKQVVAIWRWSLAQVRLLSRFKTVVQN